MSSEPSGDSGLVGGVDGVSGGWLMAMAEIGSQSPLQPFQVFSSFRDLWGCAQDMGLLAVAVDIPIGLANSVGRRCDKEAKALLKGPPNRSFSVFPAPPLCVLGASDYQEALEMARRCAGKGISKQTHALFPKIREVRSALQPNDMHPSAHPRAAEAHPEVSFAQMAGQPMGYHKRFQAGVAERLKTLKNHFPNMVDAALGTCIPGPPRPGLDDLLDAAAAAWTARRLVSGQATPLGDRTTDQAGYEMTIWA